MAFELNKASPGGEGYDADCVTQINTQGASEDHISIPEATKHGSNNVRASKFCGQSLQNSTVSGTECHFFSAIMHDNNQFQWFCFLLFYWLVEAPGPFVIHFHSDEVYDQVNKTERGFKFEYDTAWAETKPITVLNDFMMNKINKYWKITAHEVSSNVF